MNIGFDCDKLLTGLDILISNDVIDSLASANCWIMKVNISTLPRLDARLSATNLNSHDRMKESAVNWALLSPNAQSTETHLAILKPDA